MELFSPTVLLVHAAALTHVLGYVARDQLRLRLLLLIGNILYLLYYWMHPETPLWDAMFWSTVMIASNSTIILMMIRDRNGTSLTREEAAIFAKLGGLSARHFRKLLAKSRIVTAQAPTELIAANDVPAHLYFLLMGQVEITQGDRSSLREGPCFLGEVSILLNQPAIASVTARAGAQWMAISRTSLHDMTARDSVLDQDLHRLFSRDMAAKLAAA